MHPEKVKAIKTYLEQLIAQRNTLGMTAALHQQIVKQLYKDPQVTAKFSERFLVSQIVNLVRTVSTKEADLDKSLEDFFVLLENYSLEHTIYVPLSGIMIKNPDSEFALGNVVLVMSTAARREAILLNTRNILTANPELTDAAKRDYYHNWVLPVVNDVFNARVLSRYTVVAEPIRARERAEQEARRVVEVLRFYGSTLYDNSWKVRVCLRHEAPPRHQWVVAYSSKGFYPRFEVKGEVVALELTTRFLALVRSHGADKFLELITKDKNNLTTFEKKLLLSMHWVANAQMQYDNESKLLNLVSGLEALLTRGPEDPVTLAISEGTALLLSQKYETRAKIKSDIQEIYKKRSDLSHGGSKEILDSDITKVKYYVNKLLLLLLRRSTEFREPSELFAWIDRLKLT